MPAAEYLDGAIWWRGVYMHPDTAERLRDLFAAEAQHSNYAAPLRDDLTTALNQYHADTLEIAA